MFFTIFLSLNCRILTSIDGAACSRHVIGVCAAGHLWSRGWKHFLSKNHCIML